jgi:hypothetical protein
MGQESYNPTPEQEDFNILNNTVVSIQGQLLAKWFDGDEKQIMSWIVRPGRGDLLRAVVTEHVQTLTKDFDIDKMILEVERRLNEQENGDTSH